MRIVPSPRFAAQQLYQFKLPISAHVISNDVLTRTIPRLEALDDLVDDAARQAGETHQAGQARVWFLSQEPRNPGIVVLTGKEQAGYLAEWETVNKALDLRAKQASPMPVVCVAPALSELQARYSKGPFQKVHTVTLTLH